MKSVLKRVTAAIIVLVMILTLMPGLEINSKAAEAAEGFLVKFETVETSICSANSIYLTFHNDWEYNDWDAPIPFAGSNFKRSKSEILDRLGFSEGVVFDTTRMPDEVKLIDAGNNIEIDSSFENKSVYVKKGEVNAEIKVTSYDLERNATMLSQYISSKNNGIQMLPNEMWEMDKFLHENGIPFVMLGIGLKSRSAESGRLSCVAGLNPGDDYKIKSAEETGVGTFTGVISGNQAEGFWSIGATAVSIECNVVNPVSFDLNGGTISPFSLQDIRDVLPGSVYMPDPMVFTGDGQERKLLGWDTDKNAEEPKYKPGWLVYIKESTRLYAIYEKKDEPIGRVEGVAKINTRVLPEEDYENMAFARLEFDFGNMRAIAFTDEDGKFSLDTNYSGKATINIAVAMGESVMFFMLEDYDIVSGKLDHEIVIGDATIQSAANWMDGSSNKIIVNGLNRVGEDNKGTNFSVYTFLGAEGLWESEVDSYAGEGTVEELTNAIEGSKGPMDGIFYVNMEIWQKVTPMVGPSDTNDITDTGEPVEITIPLPEGYELSEIRVARKHGELYKSFTKVTDPEEGTRTDGEFYFDSETNRLTIWASKFSIYAVGFTFANKDIVIDIEPTFRLLAEKNVLTTLNETTKIDVLGLKEGTYSYIKWTSSDDSIASVDEKGVVTAHKDGEVEIKAITSDDRIASIKISVKLAEKKDDKKDEKKDEKKPEEKVKINVNKIKIRLNSEYELLNGRKAIKVTASCVEGLDELKKALDNGFMVETIYYRGESKNVNDMEPMFIARKKTYTNSFGDKGTMYYYRAKLRIYDKDGKLVGETMLSECKYANRIYK